MVFGLLFALVLFVTTIVVGASPAWTVGLVLGLRRGPSGSALFSVHPFAGVVRWLLLIGCGLAALTFTGTLGNGGVAASVWATVGALACCAVCLFAAFGIGRAQGANARARRMMAGAGLVH